MQAVTSELMEEYQAWLVQSGVTPNSISSYMRILRAIYMRAGQGLITNQMPFKHVYTSNERTAKRAITFSEIKRIKDLDLSSSKALEKSRDIFMFLFYTRSMSFVNAAYLQKGSLKGGVISYRRHKTGQVITVSVNSYISDVVERYSPKDSSYLLPIIAQADGDTRLQYQSALRRTNNHLKKIAALAKIR